MRNMRRCGIGLLAWLALLPALASDGLSGSPPYQRHAPDLDVYPQNFAVAQDAEGIVYVGNAEGVLEFDGERWGLTRLPNHEIVRSLAVGADGRVYVGGYNAFGYLQRGADGRSRFVDLGQRFRSALAGREFADIWDILVAPEGVYFRAVQDVFFWNPADDASAHWYHPGRFGGIVHHRGRTLLQFRDEGLRRRVGEGWEPLPGTSQLTSPVFSLLGLPDGSLLGAGSDGAWWRIDDSGVAPATMPEGMPAASQFENGLVLGDGSIALASDDGVVYLLDPQRRSERHFRIDSGYLSSLHAATDGGFLVSADQAIYRVAWPTEWSVLSSEYGVDGSLNGVAQWNSGLYLLSSSGVFRSRMGAGETPRFEATPWGSSTAYDLFALDANRALLARGHRLSLLEGERVRDLAEDTVYPRMFQRSRLHADRVLLGTEVGLRLVFLRTGADPELSPRLGPDLAVRITSLVETGPDEVWAGTTRHGVWRYRFDPTGRLLEARRFGEDEGLRLGPLPGASVAMLADGSVLASTDLGFFRLDGERFVESDVDGLAALRRPDEMLRLVPAANGDLWAYGNSRLFLRSRGGAWREQATGNLRRGALEAHAFLADGSVIFVSGQALLLHGEPLPMPASAPAPRVLLREVVRIDAEGEREPLPLRHDGVAEMAAGDFGIQFRFAVPDLSRADGQRYQGRLLGYESRYSEWSASDAYTYSQLPPGEYRLEVRAMDSQGRISEIEPYAFAIAPPWYASVFARLAVFLLILAALFWLGRTYVASRTRRIAAENLRLESTVQERTQALAEANRKLEQMARLDGLTGIANRRRLDEYLPAVSLHCAERTRPLSLLAIDVDHFKEYNDRNGHLAGDELLRQLSLTLAHCLRRTEDMVARYGGEEFLVVLPGADQVVAAGLAENMRKAVQELGLGCTISVGIASRIPSVDDDVLELVKRADEALYQAKERGRNRVEMAVSLPNPS